MVGTLPHFAGDGIDDPSLADKSVTTGQLTKPTALASVTFGSPPLRLSCIGFYELLLVTRWWCIVAAAETVENLNLN